MLFGKESLDIHFFSELLHTQLHWHTHTMCTIYKIMTEKTDFLTFLCTSLCALILSVCLLSVPVISLFRFMLLVTDQRY